MEEEETEMKAANLHFEQQSFMSYCMSLQMVHRFRSERSQSSTMEGVTDQNQHILSVVVNAAPSVSAKVLSAVRSLDKKIFIFFR